ncbi:hypothetical protein ACQPW3_24945 [Actinosynnema sp. CA-248983]
MRGGEARVALEVGLTDGGVVLGRPMFWVVLFLLAWLTLVVVQISMGLGGAPGEGGAP